MSAPAWSSFMREMLPLLDKSNMLFLLTSIPELHSKLNEEQCQLLLQTTHKTDRQGQEFIRCVHATGIAFMPQNEANVWIVEMFADSWLESRPSLLLPPILLLWISYKFDNFAQFGALRRVYEYYAPSDPQLVTLLGGLYENYVPDPNEPEQPDYQPRWYHDLKGAIKRDHI